MNEAETRAEHIAPLFPAAGWGEVENHFVDVSKMVWIGNGFKKAKLEGVQSIEARHMHEEAAVRKFRTTGATVAKSATVQNEVAKPLQKPILPKP